MDKFYKVNTNWKQTLRAILNLDRVKVKKKKIKQLTIFLKFGLKFQSKNGQRT